MRRAAFVVLATLCMTGCQASFQTLRTGQKDYDKAFDAVRTVMIERSTDDETDLRYFRPVYESKRDGLIVTDRSSKKVGENSQIKLRAVAVLARNDEEDIDVHVKVIKERFTETWNLLNLDVVQKKAFLGSDREMEALLLGEIESELEHQLQEPPTAGDASQQESAAKKGGKPSPGKEDSPNAAEDNGKGAAPVPARKENDKTTPEQGKKEQQGKAQKENE